MATNLDYALMSGNAYAVKLSVTSDNNTLPIPASWSKLGLEGRNDQSGFTARAYKKGVDIVIAYTGTTFEGDLIDKAKDWVFGNLIAGSGFTLAPQIIDAAKYYLDVRQNNPGANITFTGHSLGGGLASLMSVFFDRPAVVFDEAPFKKAADSALVVNGLKTVLASLGYSLPSSFSGYIALDPFGGAVIPSPTRVYREGNVSAIYLKDEILSLLQTPVGRTLLTSIGLTNPALLLLAANVSNIAGSEQMIDLRARTGDGWGWPLLNGQPIDLHYMPLLAATLQSAEFRTACQNNPEILQKIFTSDKSGSPALVQRNFLNLMVQRDHLGEGALNALAQDVGSLQGSLGTGKLKSTLVGLDIDLHYAQGFNRAEGIESGAFARAFKGVDGGIQIERRAQDEQWVGAGFARLDSELQTSFSDIAAFIQGGTERYTLSTTGALVASAVTDDKKDMMIGGSVDDTLNGGGGADTLFGRDGADTLIGDAGNDQLFGGLGNDLMQGGVGFDTYVIEGMDTIEDSDRQGSIKDKNGQRITGAIEKRADGSHVFLGDPTISVTGGSDLTLTLADGTGVTIKNYQTGDVGIGLSDNSAAAPPVNRTILGDLSPIDFEPETDGVQTRNDDLGNLIVAADEPAPGRADTLQDSAGNDDIRGLGGNDLLSAWRGGHDKIDGGDGNDLLYGGDGNDTMIGGGGRDVLVEGAGNDRLYADAVITLEGALAAEDAAPTGQQGEALSGVSGDDLAIGGAGDDALLGGIGSDILVGGAGDDNINGDAMAGNISANWSVGRNITTDASGVTIYASSYNQFSIFFPDTGGDDDIYAGGGADWVSAGSGNDYVDGGSGDDVIFGQRGNDDVFGGAGNDKLSGDSAGIPLAEHGDDYVDGEEGDDTLFGGGGSDQLLGGAGADTLYGNQGADYLDGDDGDDTVVGGEGADTLYGSAGNDFLQGDASNRTNDGDDSIDGGTGDDILLGLGGNDSIYGGEGADQIAGDYGDNAETGGNDAIYSGAGADTVDAGGGDDFVFAGDDNDLVAGGAGADNLNGGLGNDQLQGGTGDDTLSGNEGHDTLFGEDGADRLNGDDGNDYLIGGRGNDTLNGGLGDDIYVRYLGDGTDTIIDAGGNDWLVLPDVWWQSMRLGVGSLKLTLPDGAEIHLDDFDPDNPYAAGGIEYFQFADNTVLSKTQLINALGINPIGTPEADVLSGTALSETIQALAGDDIVTARAGNDTVLAGDGNDVVYAGDGNDIVYGGNGDDVLLGENGSDTLHVEAGNDLLSGGAGTDQLLGGDGDDSYLFQIGDGQDTVTDALGANSIALGAGLTLDAIVFARAGNDLLVSVKNSTDRLTVKDWFAADNHFSTLSLGDGTTLDHAGVDAAMPRNQAPLANPDSATVVEDGMSYVSGNALANDSDPEGRALRVTNPGSHAGAVGTLSLSGNGAWSYSLANNAVQSLAAGQSLTETFAYTVTDDDPNGAATAESTIRITVQGTNDLPVPGTDSASTVEDAAPISGNVLANDSDIDAGSVLTVANAGARVGSYGSLTLGNTGAWGYSLANSTAAVQALAAGQTVSDNFNFIVTDGIAQVGGNLAIHIAGQNDAPIVVTPLADQAATANKSWTWQVPVGSFADVDAGDVLSHGATLVDGSALPSWLAFDAATLTFSGRVPRDATGNIDIRVTSSDRLLASASDVFNLSFDGSTSGGGGGGGNGGGGSQGNEGVGNGVDGPPPGHDTSFNDGTGTGPGNPGAQGGNGYVPPSLADILMTRVAIATPIVEGAGPSAMNGNSAVAHASAPGQNKSSGTTNSAHASPGISTDDPIGVSPAPTFTPTDNSTEAGHGVTTGAAQGSDADTLAFDAWLATLDAAMGKAAPAGATAHASANSMIWRWAAVDAALATHLAQPTDDAMGSAPAGNGAGTASPFLATANDPLALLAGNNALQQFKGLKEGLGNIA